MKDHTYHGIPVAQLPTPKILDLLDRGVQITDNDGHGDAHAERMVRLRLEVELEIRRQARQ